MQTLIAEFGMPAWNEMFVLYLQTFGWAIVGTLAMGIGLIVTLKLFTLSTTSIDEWSEIAKGNMAMATVLAAVIIALAIVVSSVIGA